MTTIKVLNFDLDAAGAAIFSKTGFAQIAVLGVAFLIAWLIARAVRPRFSGLHEPGLAKIGAGSANRLLQPLAFLVLAWLAQFFLARYQAVPILHIALPLILSFVVIRLALYLVRHLIPPSSLLKSSERLIAFTVWILVALYLTGVLPELMGALEETKLSTGAGKGQEISLRQIIEAILLALVTVFVALSLSSLFEKKVMSAATIDISSRVVITKFVRAAALVVALLIALPLVGIPLTLLSVIGGALGVGLGFGLQKIASNYISGFIILLDRSIHLGDLVTVDTRHGVVKAINSRYTVLKSADGTEAIIPNDTLITNIVVNHSHADPLTILKTAVMISYESDVERARAILLAAAAAQPRVHKLPAPVALIKQLGDKGVELELWVRIPNTDHGHDSLRSDMLTDVLKQFDNAGVALAKPFAVNLPAVKPG